MAWVVLSVVLIEQSKDVLTTRWSSTSSLEAGVVRFCDR